mgnify:CR=1 FL=1
MGRLIRRRKAVCLLLAEPEQVRGPGLCILIFVYFYILKKPRLLDTPEWYELVKKDKVIYVMWMINMVVLVSGIGT